MSEPAFRGSRESLAQSLHSSFSDSRASITSFADDGSKSAAEVQINVTDTDTQSVTDVLSETEADKTDLSGKAENELSEEELRRLFDDEEIERFLGLFADYVSEVTIPGSSGQTSRSSDDIFHLEQEGKDQQSPESTLPEPCGEEWLSIDSSKVPTSSRIPTTVSNAQCISERIAYRYVLPVLPPAKPRPQRFTMGRLRITIQRLFLVAHPAYRKLFSRLTRLATWKDKRDSALYCTIWWTIWYRNLIMPAAFCRILYSLLRRRLLPYPTLVELRERRREAAQTEELGAQIQLRLGTTSSSGILEAWRLFRVFSKPNKAKAKEKQDKIKEKAKDKKDKKDKKKAKKDKKNESRLDVSIEAPAAESVVSLPEVSELPASLDEPTVLDNTHESKEEQDFKRELLNSLNDLADVHERVKNIFLWRQPSSSRIYVAMLVFLAALTTFLPTKYIVKIAWFIMGFLYWHVVPIIAALPPFDRARLPPLFDNAPTDAEYAMELISQRIARGEDIRPPARKQPKKSKKAVSTKSNKSTVSLVGDEQPVEDANGDDGSVMSEGGSDKSKPPGNRPGEVDWRKWGERANAMKSWAAQGRMVVSKDERKEGERRLPSEVSDGATHTFLAHYKASPGTLTISRTALFFTPVTSTRPKIRIEMDDMRGVKKIGMNAIPGLSVKWQRSPASGSYNETDAGEASAESEILEEKFRWVGGRDEVFARLVGSGGRKWLKV